MMMTDGFTQRSTNGFEGVKYFGAVFNFNSTLFGDDGSNNLDILCL